MTDTGNKIKKPRGRPFPRGNPGRPKGARNKRTRALQGLTVQQLNAMQARGAKLALNGDPGMLRFYLGKAINSVQPPTGQLVFRQIKSPQDALDALDTIFQAMATGRIDPVYGRQLADVVVTIRKSLDETPTTLPILFLDELDRAA